MHHSDERRDLGRRLALDAQGRNERAELRRSGFAVHDLVHYGGGLVLREVVAVNQLRYRLHYHSLPPRCLPPRSIGILSRYRLFSLKSLHQSGSRGSSTLSP